MAGAVLSAEEREEIPVATDSPGAEEELPGFPVA